MANQGNTAATFNGRRAQSEEFYLLHIIQNLNIFPLRIPDSMKFILLILMLSVSIGFYIAGSFKHNTYRSQYSMWANFNTSEGSKWLEQKSKNDVILGDKAYLWKIVDSLLVSMLVAV